MISKVSVKHWGYVNDEEVFLYKIENENGAYVELSNFGATVVSIVVPDRNGILGNVVLGFPTLAGYLDDTCYLGSTIGRFANRISGAKFEIDSKEYNLEPNDQGNSNHSASSGFNSRVFLSTLNERPDGVCFTLLSEDDEGGYPGNVVFRVDYNWNNNNELKIRYRAETDMKTHLNFTNHSYFNLSGLTCSVLDHRLSIASKRVLEMNSDYTPTGIVLEDKEPLFGNTKLKPGLNCYFIYDDLGKDNNGLIAKLIDSNSGRELDVYTSYPGLMLYTGDFLFSKLLGHNNHSYKPHDGLCLECQYYPDSPNQLSFPTTILNPGDKYDEYIVYKFIVK